MLNLEMIRIRCNALLDQAMAGTDEAKMERYLHLRDLFADDNCFAGKKRSGESVLCLLQPGFFS